MKTIVSCDKGNTVILEIFLPYLSLFVLLFTFESFFQNLNQKLETNWKSSY